MQRYILTGTPGSGKTAILRLLERQGHTVVEEAATDVIALEQASGDDEPWRHPSFVTKVVALQRQRQLRLPATVTGVQLFDRSPICTYALCTYLGHPVPRELSAEIDRILGSQVYARRVFLVRSLGFCEPTAARRITYEASLDFECLHEETYRALGFEVVDVPAGELAVRAAVIGEHVADGR